MCKKVFRRCVVGISEAVNLADMITYQRLTGGGGGVLFECQGECFRCSIVFLNDVHDGGARLRVPRRGCKGGGG